MVIAKYSRSGGADGSACSKCGAGDPAKRWHSENEGCQFPGVEHMHMTCGGCGYEWATLPLDAQA